jgi:hypothetical protein
MGVRLSMLVLCEAVDRGCEVGLLVDLFGGRSLSGPWHFGISGILNKAWKRFARTAIARWEDSLLGVVSCQTCIGTARRPHSRNTGELPELHWWQRYNRGHMHIMRLRIDL